MSRKHGLQLLTQNYLCNRVIISIRVESLPFVACNLSFTHRVSFHLFHLWARRKLLYLLEKGNFSSINLYHKDYLRSVNYTNLNLIPWRSESLVRWCHYSPYCIHQYLSKHFCVLLNNFRWNFFGYNSLEYTYFWRV